MTVRVTLPRQIGTGEPCCGGEDGPVVSSSTPRGWQPNPLISPEAAAMCAIDYKSAPRHLPPGHAKANLVLRTPLQLQRERSRRDSLHPTG